ncbi:MAG: tetratricopeptide repeat protein [Acidobacteria bacterium]|nr:tetratricopeptide repeat protein [Acidobacteriota bacterium]
MPFLLVGAAMAWPTAAAGAESRAAGSDPDRTALLAEGNRLHDAGRYEEAVAHYRGALQRFPGDPDFVYEISLSLYSMGRFQECVDNAEPFLKKSGRRKPAFYGLIASCFDATGNLKKANKLFDKGLKEFPDDPNLLFNAGVTRLRAHEPSEAKNLLQRAARARPQHAPSNLLLAVAYEQSGDRVPAFLAYVRYLARAGIEPTAPTAAAKLHDLLGQGLKQTGESSYELQISVPRSEAPDPYWNAGLSMTLGAAVVATEEWANRTEGEKLVYRLGAVIEALGKSDVRPHDFAMENYAPFARELRARDVLEPFVYRVFSPLGLDGFQEWLNDHQDRLRQLDEVLAEWDRP